MSSQNPTSSPPRTILAVVQSNTQFNEIFRAAIALRSSGFFKLVVCFDSMPSKLVEALSVKCKDARIEVFSFPAGSPVDAIQNLHNTTRHLEAKWARTLFKFVHFMLHAHSEIGLQSKLSNLFRACVRSLFDQPKGSFEHTLQTFLICAQADRSELERAKVFLLKAKPSAILVGEDGLGGNLALIAASRHQKCPVIIIPYEYSSSKQIFEALQSRIEQHQITSSIDRLIGKTFKKWVRNLNGTALLRLPAPMILSKEAYCLAPRNPWTVHGGQANVIAAESKKMADHYISEGIEREKIVTIGSLAGDDLWRELSTSNSSYLAYQTQSKICPTKTIAVIAFPPCYTAERSKTCEFQTYENLVDFWIETVINLPSMECVFQLHPAVQPEHRRYIESKVNVSNKDITSLIPHADLLITSVSSIIRMAISCRKPVVNYDVYNFDYPDYKQLPGVLHVNSRHAFIEQVKKLCADEEYYKLAAKYQRESSADWGELDGLASTRLVETLKKVAG